MYVEKRSNDEIVKKISEIREIRVEPGEKNTPKKKWIEVIRKDTST